MRHSRSSQLQIMLSHSLKSSSSSSHQNDEDEADHQHVRHFQALASHYPSSSSSIHHRQHLRGLLITCAELVSRSDFPSVHTLISVLSANSSPLGDSTERLVHYFSRALSQRIGGVGEDNEQYQVGGVDLSVYSRKTVFTNSVCKEHFFNCSPFAAASSSDSDGFNYSCYLWLNQITPFVRFCHLTANQAILDATDDRISQHQPIHIVDLDVMQGLQWPPLMQALADRTPNPPLLRITGFGRHPAVLRQTGDRLLRFAQSLGLTFRFEPVLVHGNDPASVSLSLTSSSLSILPEEALAVNCVLYLHRFLGEEQRDIGIFLSAVKALNPKIVTLAEREAGHDHPVFARRFAEALEHYGAVFESLEATLPPNSRERLTLEEYWFGCEISEIAAEGKPKLRHRKLDCWESLLHASGLSNVPLSSFALSQAKLLLRLHYPSDGYQLQFLKNGMFLGWQNIPLFSVSSWR